MDIPTSSTAFPHSWECENENPIGPIGAKLFRFRLIHSQKPAYLNDDRPKALPPPE